MVKRLHINEVFSKDYRNDLIKTGEKSLSMIYRYSKSNAYKNMIDIIFDKKSIDDIDCFCQALRKVLNAMKDEYLPQYIDERWLEDFIEHSAYLAHDIQQAVASVASAVSAAKSANNIVQHFKEEGIINTICAEI